MAVENFVAPHLHRIRICGQSEFVQVLHLYYNFDAHASFHDERGERGVSDFVPSPTTQCFYVPPFV